MASAVGPRSLLRNPPLAPVVAAIPVLILCVGRIAAQTLLETDTPIGKLRGKLHTLPSGRPLMVTYHPAYLLRSPIEKRKAWADLVMAMQTFERLSNEARRAT